MGEEDNAPSNQSSGSCNNSECGSNCDGHCSLSDDGLNTNNCEDKK